MYSGDILFIILKTSHAICFILRIVDDTKISYLYCFAGEGFLCVLKGFLWGYYA